MFPPKSWFLLATQGTAHKDQQTNIQTKSAHSNRSTASSCHGLHPPVFNSFCLKVVINIGGKPVKRGSGKDQRNREKTQASSDITPQLAHPARKKREQRHRWMQQEKGQNTHQTARIAAVPAHKKKEQPAGKRAIGRECACEGAN